MSGRTEVRVTSPVRACIAFLLAALGPVLFWWLDGRPVALPDAPLDKLRCVSYAPYRWGQTPFAKDFVVPRWQIEQDLKLLAGQAECVRTYATDQGIGEVPAIAREVGIKVMLGAWIGRDTENNARQIADLIRLANAYPDVIKAVIVGNEVLLRREQPAERLAAMLRQVKQAVPVPVTYADVWEFWVANPTLADAVDFITVHVLPYWENDPVGIDDALAHVRDVLHHVRGVFPGRQLHVGETGWPSAGRQRQGAAPSPVNQARYVRAFVRLAVAEDIDHNLIEAFDQPWKRLKEGTVGGRWGLFTADRTLKYRMHGPMSDNAEWRIDLAAGIVLALALFAVPAARAKGLSWGAWLGLAVAAQAAGTIIVLQVLRAEEASRGFGEWAVSVAGLGLSALTAAVLLAVFADRAGGRRVHWPRPAPVRTCVDWLCRPRTALLTPALVVGLLQTLAAAAAAVVCLWFIFDARYRDFPIAAFLIPALGFAAYRLGRDDREPSNAGREEAWLAGILLLGGAAVAFGEGIRNHHAIGWTLVAWLMAAPWLGALRGAFGREAR